MLKRLRLKFVLVIMVILTAALGLVLGTVYRFTRESLERASLQAMQAAAARPLQPGRPGEAPLPCFTLQLGRRGELLAVRGGEFYDLSDEDFLREVAGAALSAREPAGMLEEYALRFCRSSGPMGQTLVFADATGELAALRSLARTCALIGGACLPVFLGISLLLARWMVKPVERAWAQQRQFVADASHELKTPLTVILTNAELLQGPDRGGQGRYAENILVMSRQMRELVERLLDLSRADSGQRTAAPEAVDLSALVGQALLPFEPVFFEQGLTLSSRVQPGIVLEGDGQQLRQVVDILLDNARKYSSPGGTVEVALERWGRRQCRLTVSNPGEALSRAELKQIFKRFYRADPARSRAGGFGLGLAIAKEAAAAHRGRIWAESREGRIAFFVELPVKAPLAKGGRATKWRGDSNNRK